MHERRHHGLDGTRTRAWYHDYVRRDDVRVEGSPHQHYRHPKPVDFTLEVERAWRAGGAICLFDSVAGVEPQSETVWRQADKYHVPRLCFVNKMDRMGANYYRTIDMTVSNLGAARARSKFRSAPKKTSPVSSISSP